MASNISALRFAVAPSVALCVRSKAKRNAVKRPPRKCPANCCCSYVATAAARFSLYCDQESRTVGLTRNIKCSLHLKFITVEELKFKTDLFIPKCFSNGPTDRDFGLHGRGSGKQQSGGAVSAAVLQPNVKPRTICRENITEAAMDNPINSRSEA